MGWNEVIIVSQVYFCVTIIMVFYMHFYILLLHTIMHNIFPFLCRSVCNILWMGRNILYLVNFDQCDSFLALFPVTFRFFPGVRSGGVWKLYERSKAPRNEGPMRLHGSIISFWMFNCFFKTKHFCTPGIIICTYFFWLWVLLAYFYSICCNYVFCLHICMHNNYYFVI